MPDVLIYKVASNRAARLDQVLDQGTDSQVSSGTQTGIVTERAYWVLDRGTLNVVVIPYSRSIVDRAVVKEYQVLPDIYRLFDGKLAAGELFEYQAVAAPGRNAWTVTMRNLAPADGPSVSSVFYLIGRGTAVPFTETAIRAGGVQTKSKVYAPQVAQTLKGQKVVTEIISGDTITYAPSTYDAFRRESGPISATLDVRLVNKCRGVPPPTGSGLTIGTLDYATNLVQQALERLGYQNTTP